MPRERTRLLGLIAALAAWNVLINRIVPSPAYVPANVAAAAALVIAARRWGLGPKELDLPGHDPRRGVRWGAVAALVVVGFVGGVAVFGWSRRFLADGTLVDLAAAGLGYQVLIRIPLGTVIFEEIAFRGVLFSQWCRVGSTRTAMAASSLVFGVWHVLPTLGRLDLNPAGGYAVNGLATAGIVLGAVATTSIAGYVFLLLRTRSQSLLAPITAHALINSGAFLIGWFVTA